MDESTNHIVMKIFTYDYCRYIMVVNRNLTKDYFLDKAGIRGGYAKDMFSRIYDSIFSESEDLVDSYEKYYCQEFDSWGLMLEKKYNVPKETVDMFIQDLQENADYTLIGFDSLSYGENIDNLFSSGVFDKRFDQLLLMKI